MKSVWWKIASALAALFATFAVERVISAVWKKSTGHRPPDDPENPSERLGEAVAYAALSGLLVALVRLIAVRGTARVYAKSMEGPLPWEKKSSKDSDLIA